MLVPGYQQFINTMLSN